MGIFKTTAFYLSIISGVFLLTGCQKTPSIEDSQDTSENEVVSTNLSQLSDEELLASGQWRDPETGLIWMRCTIGQKWENNTCNGEPLLLNGNQALRYFDLFNQEGGFAGEVSWRLPTLKETISLRKCKNGWERDIRRGEVLTTSGPEMQNIDYGEIMQTIPVDGKLVEIPKSCEAVITSVEKDEYGDEVKTYDPYLNSLAGTVFLNVPNTVYYTSTGYSEQRVLHPLANENQLWTFSLVGGSLTPNITAYPFAILAVREP